MIYLLPLMVAGVFWGSSSAASVHGQCGPLSGQVFRCPAFGFTYKVSFGWVDRTAEMNEPGAEEKNVGKPAAALSHSETLLAVFERPPGVSGNTINSAVVIAAESLTDYPQIKKASDYFGPLTEIAEARGFKALGEPYLFSIGVKQLVRGDFSMPRGPLTMYQTNLAMIEKDRIVSFTLIAGSEEEIDDLIDQLSFAPKSPARK